MKTHQDQVREARIIAANATPGPAKRLPPGYSNVFEKFKAEEIAKKKPPRVTRREKVYDLHESGRTIDEIAIKMKMKKSNVIWNICEHKKRLK